MIACGWSQSHYPALDAACLLGTWLSCCCCRQLCRHPERLQSRAFLHTPTFLTFKIFKEVVLTRPHSQHRLTVSAVTLLAHCCLGCCSPLCWSSQSLSGNRVMGNSHMYHLPHLCDLPAGCVLTSAMQSEAYLPHNLALLILVPVPAGHCAGAASLCQGSECRPLSHL